MLFPEQHERSDRVISCGEARSTTCTQSFPTARNNCAKHVMREVPHAGNYAMKRARYQMRMVSRSKEQDAQGAKPTEFGMSVSGAHMAQTPRVTCTGRARLTLAPGSEDSPCGIPLARLSRAALCQCRLPALLMRSLLLASATFLWSCRCPTLCSPGCCFCSGFRLLYCLLHAWPR